MKNTYDAIVVGGGIAGLTSTAYLSRHGLCTLLVEKGDKTGGLTNTFWYRGFAFDAGIRAFENSGIIFPMLKSLGLDIDFVRNPVKIGIKDHWVNLQTRDSIEDYTAMLTDIFPDDSVNIKRIAKKIIKVMSYMDVLYGIDNPLLIEDIRNREYIIKTLLPWLIKYQINIRKAGLLNEPVYAYLKKITKNDALIDIIAQHFFKNTTTFFALSYFSLYMDYIYPVGGIGIITQRMTDYIHSTGGEILTKTAVIKVNTQNKEVSLNNGDKLNYKKLGSSPD